MSCKYVNALEMTRIRIDDHLDKGDDSFIIFRIFLIDLIVALKGCKRMVEKFEFDSSTNPFLFFELVFYYYS